MKNYSDRTMLQPNTMAISLLMAENDFDSISLAEAAGVSRNIVYSIRRGCHAKPKYFGRIAKALKCEVSEIITMTLPSF